MRPELQTLLGELNQLLWRQRNVLSDFLYRLEVQQLLLVDGRDRWMDRCVEDLERAIERIGRYEEMQQNLLDELAPFLAIGRGSDLSDVVAAAPSPWDDMFDEHRAAFLVLINEIESASRDNHGLVRRALGEVAELLDMLGQPGSGSVAVEGYGPAAGRGLRRPGGAMLLDRQV